MTTFPTGAFSDLAELLESGSSLDEVLAHVVDVAVGLVEGCGGASVTSGDGRRPRTVAAAGDRDGAAAVAGDELQYAVGEGPCLAALDEPVARFDPTAAPDRWPELARRWPVDGPEILSHRLVAPHGRAGRRASLNLYGTAEGGFGAGAAQVASILAAHAAAAATATGEREFLEREEAGLRHALEARDVIGQAKGVLMARSGLTADEAFERLRMASQRTNRRLRDVAADIAAHAGAGGSAPV